jgi:SAM-dependent methyltransferase
MLNMKEVNKNIDECVPFYSGSTAAAVKISFASIIKDELGELGNLGSLRVLVAGDKSMFAGVVPNGATFVSKEDVARGDLGFPDCSFDEVIIFNAIDEKTLLDGFMREVWRVLEDGGKMLFFAPSPISFWRMDKGTPLGSGLSFCPLKLWFRLARLRFTPLKVRRALLLPPRFYNSSWAAREAKYQFWLAPLAGAFAMLCEKRLIAMPPKVRARIFSPKVASSAGSATTAFSKP